ncbi:MAG: RsmB/NOP family class I SAM-dependent RNA methyltransferase, partial [Cyanothece sp. SIO2G6]|nr:RsmB/NOP family class I SAM-dependent RNA methyltransferase [Cyanothece sp. SIO2G6]
MYYPLLARYVSIIEGSTSTWGDLGQPLPACLWVNSLKIQAAKVEAWLEAQGFHWEPITWSIGGYRVWNWEKPGRSLPFVCGWYGVQEEIARTAVQMLTPQPGDRILDLCAAPGGKTAQLALAVGETGMVLANERSLPRLSSLWSTITRLGLTNVLTSHADGRDFAAPPHSFDRVLVDAPCSGEGTMRKKNKPKQATVQPPHPVSNSEETSHRLVAIQRQLLDRALALVKPGGIVVYSTCTFAPEENEAVVDAVVGDRGVIEPYDIPGLQRAAGLTHWQGQNFRSDSVHAHRYWPHLNNTGGFFVARIRRTDTNLVPNPQAIEQAATTVQPVPGREAIAWLHNQ